MTCSILDKLYFDGMKQPILGTFTLKLGELLTETDEMDAMEIANIDYFNQILS
jgi:hypothetical protein